MTFEDNYTKKLDETVDDLCLYLEQNKNLTNGVRRLYENYVCKLVDKKLEYQNEHSIKQLTKQASRLDYL